MNVELPDRAREPGERPLAAATARPWTRLYRAAQPTTLVLEHESALAMFRSTVRRSPSRPLIHYLDATLTAADIDRASDALACALCDMGVTQGDRVALYLQNVPQYVLAMLATWKSGGIAVPVNPMLKRYELAHVLIDCGATVLVALEGLYVSEGCHAVADAMVREVITTSELEFVNESRWAVLAPTRRLRPADTHDLMDLVARADGRRPPAQVLSRDDVAVLTYTSGTTGPPKGAMNTHGNVLFTSQAYREWVDLTREDVILGIAPLFHVTGLIGHLGVSLLTGAPLVLGYRFDASTIAELVALWQPTFSIAAITAYRALLEEPLLRRSGLGRLRKLYTGGAPVPSATLDVFDSAFDVYLHNAYGLTETTSPATLTPLGTRAPIDPTSGTVSIGVPIYDTDIRVLDDDERVLAPGEVGEIVISGPQVVPGYWDKPEETAHVLRGGALHTGDVGFTDERGWVYLVDRKKDMIAAAGYKVWPREVEDVLYEHPAVREAAVVGEPDPYRGETVAAYVSLQPEAEIGSADLIAYCRERMAAYKYPRRIEIVEELPKTASGKILRRALRAVRTGE